VHVHVWEDFFKRIRTMMLVEGNTLAPPQKTSKRKKRLRRNLEPCIALSFALNVKSNLRFGGSTLLRIFKFYTTDTVVVKTEMI
jgi:hypothetical protein